MESSLLKTAGEIAGIAGLVLGVFFLILQAMLKKNIFPKLAQKRAHNNFFKMMLFAVVLALFGIIAWFTEFIRTPDLAKFQKNTYSTDGSIISKKDADKIAEIDRGSTSRSAANKPIPDNGRITAKKNTDKIAPVDRGSTSQSAANEPIPDNGAITAKKDTDEIAMIDRDLTSQNDDYEPNPDDVSITAEKDNDRIFMIDRGLTSRSADYEPTPDDRNTFNLPNQIEKVFIIMQNPGPLVDGSSEFYYITDPNGLLAKFAEAVAYAKKHGKRLIIAASDSKGIAWYQKEIKYNGKLLREVFYRNPEETKNSIGAELPLN